MNNEALKLDLSHAAGMMLAIVNITEKLRAQHSMKESLHKHDQQKLMEMETFLKTLHGKIMENLSKAD